MPIFRSALRRLLTPLLAVAISGSGLLACENATAASAVPAPQVAQQTGPAPAPNAETGQTVIDIAGRPVKIPPSPKRILLGENRLLMAVALLEGKEPLARIVGWQGDLPTEDPQTFAAYAARFPRITQIPLIGRATEYSVSPEKALSLKPDVAIFSVGGEGPGRYNALVKQLESIGTTVVFVDFRQHPLKDTLPSIRLLGEVLHRNDEANAYIQFYTEHLARVESVVSKI